MSENKDFLDDHEMDLFHTFLQQEENKAEFELVAEEFGFEPDKIQKIYDEIRLFISARIMKKWDEDGRSPQKVDISISLDIA